MLRIFTTVTASLATTAALAHPGHLDLDGGHTHYVVLGALVIAVAIGAGAFVSWRRRQAR